MAISESCWSSVRKERNLCTIRSSFSFRQSPVFHLPAFHLSGDSLTRIICQIMLGSLKEYLEIPETVRYTDFLLATASGNIEDLATPTGTVLAAYILGAIAPHFEMCSYIGKHIRSLLNPRGSTHPYESWIGYSSYHTHRVSIFVNYWLDRLSGSLSHREQIIIRNLYHRAVQLELDFFSGQPMVQKSVVPLVNKQCPSEQRVMVFCNFDLICTRKKSSIILADITQATRESQAQISRRQTWEKLFHRYRGEYERCIDKILLPEKAKKFNYAGLNKALEHLTDFETRANNRVIRYGALEGIEIEEINRAGENIPFKDGCIRLFHNIAQTENTSASIHVISFSWCSILVKAAFEKEGLHMLDIHANELTYKDSISTGEILRTVESPTQKVQLLNRIRHNTWTERKKLIVYIGQSVGDLPCLLEADIGIVIGSCKSLRKVGRHYGVSFVPLYHGLIKKQKEISEGSSGIWKGLSGILYTVSSWDEVRSLILGYH